MSKLDELLSRLPYPDKAQSLNYEGRAVSRDKDSLHLAVSSGVIAIPLADITEVNGLSGQSSDIVSVDVKSADRIRQLRHVTPMFRRGGFGGAFGGLNFGSDTPTAGYVDSSTVTGGRADATDDTEWVETVDDVRV